MRRPAAWLLTFALGAEALASFEALPARASSSDPRYRTRGVVKSFGPDRAYVNIAHEKIDGYMAAMTMSFEPRTSNQLADVKPGDTVAFTFVATQDGRRVIVELQKLP